VASYRNELIQSVEAIAFIDTLYVRARYAIHNRCCAADLVEGRIKLQEARHPLLGSGAVPITIDMHPGCRTLIVTGPNTGGKTVSLKTLGILALMNQFGMEIPVAEGSALDVFDDVFADIGDEQSIEQSLSTFSSHVHAISRIVESSTRSSLVLLDELGAGTDPEEGVALAMAILDHFIDKGCFTLCTTHHGILKNYGYTKEGVANASMEFDKTTLVPTYRILFGIPGESHALEIAEREGMRSELVRIARAYLHDERSDISELIRRLTKKERELLEAERSQQEKETELREKRRESDLMQLRLRQKELELREHGLGEMRSFLDTSREQLDLLIREIREGELTKEKTRKASRFLEEIRERLKTEEIQLDEEQTDRADFEVVEGLPVIVSGSGRRGKVIRRGKGRTWIVETENLRVSLTPQEFYPAADRSEGRSVKDGTVEIVTSPSLGETPELELDVRGLRFDEAISRLEKQIDNALLSGLREFSVVHGKGEGVLQQGIHKHLKRHRLVKEFHFSRPEEGGFGKTIVSLKDS
jgi:DNA mismatch repair protein MutS2